MKPEIIGVVARRLVSHFGYDSGLSVRNRILIASCLFQLARLSQDLTAQTIDLWLKSIAGKVNGFSQIRLLDVCHEFRQNNPEIFQSIWQGNAEMIYDFLSGYAADEPYRQILKLTLFVLAEDFFENSRFTTYEKRLAAERYLSSDEELAVCYLKTDFRRVLNMEIGELAFTQLGSAESIPQIFALEVVM